MFERLLHRVTSVRYRTKKPLICRKRHDFIHNTQSPQTCIRTSHQFSHTSQSTRFRAVECRKRRFCVILSIALVILLTCRPSTTLCITFRCHTGYGCTMSRCLRKIENPHPGMIALLHGLTTIGAQSTWDVCYVWWVQEVSVYGVLGILVYAGRSWYAVMPSVLQKLGCIWRLRLSPDVPMRVCGALDPSRGPAAWDVC